MSTSRVTEYLSTIPIITKVLLILNVSIHILVFIMSYPIYSFTMNPAYVLKGEYYRILTSVFLHGGILHILMNMSTLLAIGPRLENRYGSFKMILITLWTIILAGIIFVILVWIYSFVISDPPAINTNAIGYSGVLFCYAVIEAFHSTETSRSIFGIFTVPIKAYPFILLFVIQIVMPNISLWGHLSGLLVGLFLMSRIGNQCLLPSSECLLYIEQQLLCCRKMTQVHGFISVTNNELVHNNLDVSCNIQSITIFFESFCFIIVYGLRFVWNIVATLLFMIGIQPQYIEESFCTFISKLIDLLKTITSSIYKNSCGWLNCMFFSGGSNSSEEVEVGEDINSSSTASTWHYWWYHNCCQNSSHSRASGSSYQQVNQVDILHSSSQVVVDHTTTSIISSDDKTTNYKQSLVQV